MKKAGGSSGLETGKTQSRLLSEKHVPRLLERPGDSALVLGGKAGVLAGQDLAGVSHEMAHDFWRREGNFRGRGSLLLFFGSAHVSKEGEKVVSQPGLSTRILEWSHPMGLLGFQPV